MKRKYGNKSCCCLTEHWHDSVFESQVCDKLLAMAKGKEIKGYKIQQTYPLDVKGKHICDHRVDFWVLNNDGSIYVLEAKGFATETWRLKKKLFEAVYPEIPYKVVSYGDRNWRL